MNGTPWKNVITAAQVPPRIRWTTSPKASYRTMSAPARFHSGAIVPSAYALIEESMMWMVAPRKAAATATRLNAQLAPSVSVRVSAVSAITQSRAPNAKPTCTSGQNMRPREAITRSTVSGVDEWVRLPKAMPAAMNTMDPTMAAAPPMRSRDSRRCPASASATNSASCAFMTPPAGTGGPVGEFRRWKKRSTPERGARDFEERELEADDRDRLDLVRGSPLAVLVLATAVDELDAHIHARGRGENQ